MLRRRLTLVLLAVLCATQAALSAPVPAGAQALEARTTPVMPGLFRQEIRFRLDDGREAVANVLSFRADDPKLRLRPVLGQDRVPGLETVHAMGRRLLPAGGVAGINGGFWLNNPVGDPNSMLSIDGRLVSESETQGAGPRGTFARRVDGSFVMDRVGTEITLTVNEETTPHRVTALNRFSRATQPYPDDTLGPVYVYTPHFGSQVTVEQLAPNGTPLPLRILVVDALIPAADGRSGPGVVDRIQLNPGPVPIPSAGVVVAAHGQAATRMTDVVPGDRITLDVAIRPLDSPASDWEALDEALAAGPLIVRRGERVDPSQWENEGFAPATHSNVRHPRSAIARTGDGRILLVTVDGRQRGYSAGMTMHELSHFLRTLGAVDGLSLDGGGSSQLVTDGVLRNRPCCDASLRPVATGLFVFHDYDLTRTDRLSGSGREATAAAVALAGHPDGAKEVVIAAAANFPDALAGGPLAHILDAPLLLAGADELPVPTLDALAKLQPQRVTILGGTKAVGQAVEDRLRTRYSVRRLGGVGRAETAAAIARAIGSAHPRVFLARADRFPDALAAAAPGGLLRMPILLTGPDGLHPATAALLVEAGVREVVVVGGGSALGEAVTDELRAREIQVTRLSGKSRFGTAAAVNRWTAAQLGDLDDTAMVVAAGADFPDALAGGPLAARRRQLLMTLPTVHVDADEEAKAYLQERAAGALERVTVVGGHAVLSSYAQWQLHEFAVR